jgi:hypothetical protein
MLYGVRPDLRDALARDGYVVRCYVPYGRDWFTYFLGCVRRLPGGLAPRRLTRVVRAALRRPPHPPSPSDEPKEAPPERRVSGRQTSRMYSAGYSATHLVSLRQCHPVSSVPDGPGERASAVGIV